jgi:hypothetical protein
VQITFNGHEHHTTRPWSVGRLVSRDDAGRSVFQMLANYQDYRKGDGYLRLVRVYPGEGRIAVRTFSPSQNRFLADGDNQFSFGSVPLLAW